ncbi:hypothetical protein [Actinoalloteichus hymeniacidonis]|uniref:Uncharacterized protein n=1 Tax=Actinoalloteichus hymeniacidonis TaxID=340345 RepID=A0AAC9HMZ8_9PSEU|nr:hypothetical protein [Actinoalloteichus hymeniacidonis]AOS62148.1 hypothetical protein TL08_06620 [Actinoalloteichus hymeniacidonis]MBB5909830.1 hypothetical protein [Actinoalloteichus hymeniacidonis]
MGYRGPLPKKFIGRYNAFMLSLRDSPRWGDHISGWLTTVTYTGRRTGRTISLPVAYRRNGDRVTIDVKLPDAKKWWRNFTGEGAPLTLNLDGVDRTGHAIARRDDRQRVYLAVELS